MSARTPSKAAAPLELNSATSFRDCLACGILAVDAGKQIIVFNHEAETLTRLPAAQVLNRAVDVLPASLREIVLETLAASRPISERQVQLPLDAGDTVALRVSTTLFRSRTDAATGVIAVLHNLNATRRLEQNLRRLDRLAGIGTLATGMAHEIKNALVSVKTFVDLLLEKNQDAELAEVVRREMCRIDGIVSHMLQFAAPARPTFSPVSVHEILDHSLRLIQPRLEGGLISLRRACAAAPDTVQGDDYQLEQAFVNLLLNALEAMGPHGELTVATEILAADCPPAAAAKDPHLSRLRVTIQDTGIGIAPENLSRLFEPFFTTKKNGTGLGLCITRRIVHEHHGEILVESAPNKGTAFRLLFPLVACG